MLGKVVVQLRVDPIHKVIEFLYLAVDASVLSIHSSEETVSHFTDHNVETKKEIGLRHVVCWNLRVVKAKVKCRKDLIHTLNVFDARV